MGIDTDGRTAGVNRYGVKTGVGDVFTSVCSVKSIIACLSEGEKLNLEIKKVKPTNQMFAGFNSKKCLEKRRPEITYVWSLKKEYKKQKVKVV